MTSTRDSRIADPDPAPTGLASPFSAKNRSPLASILCSCAALIIGFLGLERFDLPVTKYVRSVTVHLPWDQLTIPWMAFTSNAGDWIGQGWRLASVSVILLAVSWAFQKPVLKIAAIQSLIAHGIAAILANGFKHIVGRPRPKFAHSGDWQMGMSWVSGWDSFPSGHSTASFAVATVLAKRFPAWAPLCIGIAIFVAVSRVLRGSHFPTDVMGGAALGILSGSIASAPLRSWRMSLQEGCRYAAVASSIVLAILWTMSHRVEDGFMGMFGIALGVAVVMGGLWLRWNYWRLRERAEGTERSRMSLYLIAGGLAAMTTSPLVPVAVGLTCLGFWLRSAGPVQGDQEQSTRSFIAQEGALLGGLALAVLVLVNARGVMPFQ